MFIAEEKLMMARSIINIDNDLCIGCGLCVMDCPRGALTVEEGKAVLINDKLCLGDGKCLASCPAEALLVIRRTAEPFDIKEYFVLEEEENAARSDYANLFAAVLHQPGLGDGNTPKTDEASDRAAGQCNRQAENPPQPGASGSASGELAGIMRPSTPEGRFSPQEQRPREQNWPIKLSQISHIPSGADILLCADCAAAKTEDFQERYARNKYLVTFCPMLEETGLLASRLATLFTQSKPRSLTTLRMVVECCQGAHMIGTGALNMSGAGVTAREVLIGQDGREIN